MQPENLAEALPAKKYIAVDGNENIIDPSHVIFPIIRHNNKGIVSLIGTGFFISENGIFITAKHVLLDVIDEAKGRQTDAISLVQFLDGSYIIRPIARCTSHENADISVGIAAEMVSKKTGKTLKNKILKLTSGFAEQNAHVFTYAYPKTTVKQEKTQELHFYPEYYDGVVQAHYPYGRDKVLLPGPCTQTSMHIRGGASGGPVFTKEGVVCAVNSTGYEDDQLSFITPVEAIENLILSGIRTPNNTTGNVKVSELIEGQFIDYR